MSLIKILLLCTLIYASIEDYIFLSIHICTWILIHILLIIIQWKCIFILPFYWILYRFIYMGLADWIVLLCIFVLCDNPQMSFIIFYIFAIALIDLKEKKSPLITAATFSILCNFF